MILLKYLMLIKARYLEFIKSTVCNIGSVKNYKGKGREFSYGNETI